MYEVDSGLDCLVPWLPALKTLLHSSDDERNVPHDTGLPTTEHKTGGVIDLVELQLNSSSDSFRVTLVCDDKAIKPQILNISGKKEVNNIQMNFIQEIPGLESSKANNLGLDIGKQVPIPGLLALELHPGSVVDVVDKEMQPQILKLSKIGVQLENENRTPPTLASTKGADNINSD